ncbi:VIT1/CCC1 transporter family protein [Candidatus Daviesbacteria bacterium]|nr:VIT1/CCC1 transporter family protein [Candidatus Daviesbacteria bacterium]
MQINLHEDYLRSLLFGFQDGLVSTTGVVVGISTGVEDKAIIILASFVAVTVEASSMAAGQYSSEKAVHQMAQNNGRHSDSLIMGAFIMFFSYLMAGMIPILPTVLFDQPLARYLAIVFAFLGLFVIGFVKGQIVNHKPLRSAIELLAIGGAATIVGVVVGNILKV